MEGEVVEPITEDEKRTLSKRGVCRSCAFGKKRSLASMKCFHYQSFTCKNHSTVGVVCNNKL